MRWPVTPPVSQKSQNKTMNQKNRIVYCHTAVAVLGFSLVFAHRAESAVGRIVTGVDAGTTPHVKAFTTRTFANVASFFAFTPSFSGGVRVATGDVNGDGAPDLIAGSGPGSAHVKVFSGRDQSELRSFLPYGAGFSGGVFVAAGDVNGDGFEDIVTGTDSGSAAHVKVFDGRTGSEVRSFFAYPAGFTGGVRVATGDVNGDGRADIITGTGPGGAPHVKVFDGVSLNVTNSFFPFDATFAGGAYVAAGDVNGDGVADIVTGAGPGGGPHVKVFNGSTSAEIHSFFAYSLGFSGGVRVAAGDVNGDGRAEIVTGPGGGALAHVRVLGGAGLDEITNFFAYPEPITNGVFVSAASFTAPRDFVQGSPAANLINWSDVKPHAGLPADPVEAARWFREAARAGKSLAGLKLAKMYRDGRGVAHDPVQALALFISVASREEEARTEEQRLRAELSSAQAAEAEARSRLP